MRKLLSCVLMMTLLLAGCGGQQSESDSPEQLAAKIRGEYLSLSGWTGQVEVTAHYDQQVYQFTMDAAWSREGETVLTVTAPELLAGVTARIQAGEGRLEYDGAGLSTGALDDQGLTPIAAVPALMDQLGAGYIARSAWQEGEEGRQLYLQCRDPERAEGEGTQYELWLDPDTHALEQAEVSVDGTTRLSLVFSDFTMELTSNETGDDADLGGDPSGSSGT